MTEFINWLKEYPLYAVGLVVVVIAAIFVFKAAGKSYKRYYERYRKEEAEIKRLVALKERYGELSEDVIKGADENELLEGVALSYQLKLQKFENMEEEFSKLNREKQYVYALDFFSQEKSVKEFFKQNGKELTEIIIPAFHMIGLEKEGDMLNPLRLMYDEQDYTTSIDENKIKEVENYFETAGILTKVKEMGAKYIRENPEKFI